MDTGEWMRQQESDLWREIEEEFRSNEMFQIHYRTLSGKGVILYPKDQREVESMLKKLAYRHIESRLIMVFDAQSSRHIGGTEYLDPIQGDKCTWWYERGPLEGRL